MSRTIPYRVAAVYSVFTRYGDPSGSNLGDACDAARGCLQNGVSSASSSLQGFPMVFWEPLIWIHRLAVGCWKGRTKTCAKRKRRAICEESCGVVGSVRTSGQDLAHQDAARLFLPGKEWKDSMLASLQAEKRAVLSHARAPTEQLSVFSLGFEAPIRCQRKDQMVKDGPVGVVSRRSFGNPSLGSRSVG